MEKLQFSKAPVIHLARCVFYTPIVIRYRDVRMLEIAHEVMTYTTVVPIYSEDGDLLATAKGIQLQLTEAGKKHRIMMRYLPDGVICEVNKKAVFDIRRQGLAILRMNAELYTNDGTLLTWNDVHLAGRLSEGTNLDIMSVIRPGNVVQNCTVGIQIGDAATAKCTAFNCPLPAFALQ
jgi:hypothetical protein